MPQEITRRSQEDTDFASGQTGERLAELFLEKNKFKVIARRYRALKAEIDIIGYDKDVLCFVEVKSQKKISTVPPHHQVSVRKQAHLVRAARSYLQDHFPKQRPVCRFDVFRYSTQRRNRKLSGCAARSMRQVFDARRFFCCSHTYR